MNLLKLFLVAILLLIGLFNSKPWRHDKPEHQTVSQANGPVHDEIIKNAERLADTLAKVRRTAETNKETRK